MNMQSDRLDYLLTDVEGFINRIPWLKRLYIGLVLAVVVGLAALAVGWLV